MTTSLRKSWRSIFSRPAEETQEPSLLTREKPARAQSLDLNLAPDDLLLALFLSAPGVVEIDRLDFESAALEQLKQAGVRITVPLVSQGELIGLLNLGSRLSEQDYTTDDRRLLNTLATQAAPALRVAQLARQQQIEARERERMEQELRVARVIQQTLLPRELPELQNWLPAALWQPARAVSGDFYDFIPFPDGKWGVIVADVTDKGVPAALVMATTRSILRAAAERYSSPSEILAYVNDMLCPDIPPNMFVTCLYIVLDTTSGFLRFANAGHNLPAQITSGGVHELRATGMPLGLMPGMVYEEKEAQLSPGDGLLLYSDGLVEAHSPSGEMFGFPRLRELLAREAVLENRSGEAVIDILINQLAEFTGPGWEQEDDVTLLTLEYVQERASAALQSTPAVPQERILLGEFSLSSEPGNELLAVEQVAAMVRAVGLEKSIFERLKTAVAETTMNAIEHGNRYQEDLLVEIQVLRSSTDLMVRVSDHGGSRPIPEPDMPDLEAKLAGLQSPRGWGLFLIKNMVDEMNVQVDDVHHTVELIFSLEGKQP